MFFYNIKSNSHIFHHQQCRYVMHKAKETLGQFYTASEARSAGFKACKICHANLNLLYKREEKKLLSYAAYNVLSVELCGNYISIMTIHSKWMVTLASENRTMQLYHKNMPNFYYDVPTDIPGYHLQNAKSSTILGFMKYIFQHETFRHKHPVVIPSQPPPPPRKGTKRVRKVMKEQKRRDKRHSIRGVLDLIDSLQTEK